MNPRLTVQIKPINSLTYLISCHILNSKSSYLSSMNSSLTSLLNVSFKCSKSLFEIVKLHLGQFGKQLMNILEPVAKNVLSFIRTNQKSELRFSRPIQSPIKE